MYLSFINQVKTKRHRIHPRRHKEQGRSRRRRQSWSHYRMFSRTFCNGRLSWPL